MSAVDWNESAQPGFDLHMWESTWASVEEDMDGDPDAALSQYAELVERMLATSGYAVGDAIAAEGDEPEVVATYRAARETAERAEVGSASRGEAELAIDDLRSIFEALASASRMA